MPFYDPSSDRQVEGGGGEEMRDIRVLPSPQQLQVGIDVKPTLNAVLLCGQGTGC